MKVTDGVAGGRYIVAGIDLEAAVERRLEILGMTEGTALFILNKKNRGAVILKVRGTRFAVGREIAAGIRIEATHHE